MTAKNIANTLRQTGLCVCPHFLSPRVLRNTADDLDAVRARGEFRRARVGRDETMDSGMVRNDDTFWLRREDKNLPQAALWRRFDLLQQAINRSLFLGLTEFEGHYAVYPEGGFYTRHRDSFRGDSRRVVSFVLYLNRAWKSEDGGRLRVYATNHEGVESHTDIAPVGGTMVCFLSGESEHEVLLSHVPRFSLSGWFKRREP